MPWLLGNESSLEVLKEVCKDELLSRVLEPDCLYAGNIQAGFQTSRALDQCFRDRVMLGLRGGWSAIAFTARSQQSFVRKALRDFAAPTSPGPRAWAPNGFYLLEKRRLTDSLASSQFVNGVDFSDQLHHLQLKQGDFFCDPVLEFELDEMSPGELEKIVQGSPNVLSRMIRLGSALF